MSEWTDIIDGLADHLALLKELGTRSVEVEPAVIRALAARSGAAAAPLPAAVPAPPARPAVAAPPAAAPPVARPGATRVLTLDQRRQELAAIAARAEACETCVLRRQRNRCVPGQGNPLSPDVMFIGEAPGADEDRAGEAFVGAAGHLLTKMITAMGYTRDDIFIANICKCRPPGNRTPEAAEMAACWPYLERQIALLKPKVIVLLGKVAVHAVLRDDKPLGGMRGKPYEFAGIPVVVTYHPAYLLRNLPDKAKAWEDLLFARRILRERAAPELPF